MPGPSGDDEPVAARAAGLSAFQLEVAQLFFSLRASRGFLLAGGGALLAQRFPKVCFWPAQPRSTLASTSRFSLT